MEYRTQRGKILMKKSKLALAETAFKRRKKLTSLQIARISKRINPADVVFQLRKKYGHDIITTTIVHNRLTGESYGLYTWRG